MPVIIREDLIKEVMDSLPEMPYDKASRFVNEYKLGEGEAEILAGDRLLSEFFESTVREGAPPKAAANWVLGELLRLMKETDLSSADITLKPAYLSRLIALVESGSISNTAGKEVFKEMYESGATPDEIVEKNGLSQISSKDDLSELVRQVLKDNPKSVEDYRNGKAQAAGYLVGQVMKASRGKANPKIVQELVILELGTL
jgi:aspartyl-tRNA(Asn)/glutamyl-tRNA(Gln) amidotransferase subunit B